MRVVGRPRSIVRLKRLNVIRAHIDPVEVSKTVGKGITLWVLFTSGLNWIFYKRINDLKNKNDKE